MHGLNYHTMFFYAGEKRREDEEFYKMAVERKQCTAEVRREAVRLISKSGHSSPLRKGGASTISTNRSMSLPHLEFQVNLHGLTPMASYHYELRPRVVLCPLHEAGATWAVTP
jgi:hypothetical protein